MKINCEINGARVQLEVPGDRRVIDLLREDLGLIGSKEGCGTGECGACTVQIDGEAKLSCLMLAAQLEGKRLITIEGLTPSDGALSEVQQAFVDHGAVQCGFCTPGMVVTAEALLAEGKQLKKTEIAEAISGNICRCTGYQRIISAIESAGAKKTGEGIILEPIPLSLPPVRHTDVRDRRQVLQPKTLTELWHCMADFPGAMLLAGGTDLLVWLRRGKVKPGQLISLDGIVTLRGISETADGIRIGAATSHAEIAADPCIRCHFSVLGEAIKTLGSPHIRRMGTIGGNIVTASPAGDTLPPLLVHGAEVELLAVGHTRRMPLADFLVGPGKTLLAPQEILTAVHLPRPIGRSLQFYEKVGLRGAMACAVASFAACIMPGPDGQVQSARLAWGSVGPTALRLPEVEAALVGKELSEAVLKALKPLILAGVSPIDDIRASAAYRRQVAANLLLRLAEPAAAILP